MLKSLNFILELFWCSTASLLEAVTDKGGGSHSGDSGISSKLWMCFFVAYF